MVLKTMNMKVKTIKAIWDLALISASSGTLFWIIETSYFIIGYGWHLKAINKAEWICDRIVEGLWAFGSTLFLVVVFVVIDAIINKSDTNEL